jgi:hypothetical protein
VELITDLVEGHEEWEVDSVVASRHTGKKKTLQYLVRWKGFSEAHNSWEPKGNLNNASLKMKEFHNKNPKAICRMVISPQEIAMESSPLLDISSLCTQFENLSLMSSRYSSPSPATRNIMLAVDTKEVAVLEASLHPTTEAPPAFPEEPEYAPPVEEPPNIDGDKYLCISPSGYSLHLPSHHPSPEPLPIPPPCVHPLPQDNPDDPRNRVRGLSDFAREHLFYSTTGLAAAELMLARQEEVEHLLVLDPDTNKVHRIATPLSSPSNTDTHSTPATTADSLPSHYTIEVDTNDIIQEHPLEDWIRFDPDLHHTSIQILATEAEPLAKVPACFVCFRVEPITGEPTIYGTMGVGRPIYAESLEAALASWAVPADYRDDDYFKMLTEERMIGGPLKRAIEDLGDYRVKADVMHLCNLESDRCKLALRLQEVQALEAYTQKR